MPHKLVFTIALSAVFMLAPFAIDMYLPALPSIALDLNTGIDQVEATVPILLFGYALGQLILGPLSDKVGRPIILFGGLILFAAGCLLASFSQTIGQLYICRFIQAIGGAGSVVVFPLIKDWFGEEESGKMISYIMALTVIAPLIAPIIGGAILVRSNWQTIFLFMAFLSLMAFAMCWYVLHWHENHKQNHKDFVLSDVIESYKHVLTNKIVLLHILAGAFAFAGLFAFVAGSPYVYISYFDVAPQTYGILVGLNAVAMIIANLINARILHKVNPTKKTIYGAAALANVGAILLLTTVANLGLVVLISLIVLFVGLLGFTATNAIVGALSFLPEDNGTVSAINGALQFSLGAFFSYMVSVLISSDATPMAMVMCITSLCALAAGLMLYYLTNKNDGDKAEVKA